jgi:serine/threonine-protein phosphatase 6 regulatory ankyrin repeat subunit A
MVPVVQELLSRGSSVFAEDEDGYTPALSCAPNHQVADCLSLILATMMPPDISSLNSTQQDSLDGTKMGETVNFKPVHNSTA